jgi:hypothetical protein
MDVLVILRTLAAVTTVLAAALVAANLNARVTVVGFVIFIVACIAWMIDGWIESKASLVIQNVILLSSMSSAFGGGTQGPRRKRRASDHAT